MIVNGQALLDAAPIKNMLRHKARHKGVSHGLTECGYDIRLAETVVLMLGRRFVLSYAMEEFDMPDDLMGRVINKSTWARMGVDASMTTNIEPGWRGFLTLELRYARCRPLVIPAGVGIAQVIFDKLWEKAAYAGKYQHQKAEAVPARFI